MNKSIFLLSFIIVSAFASETLYLFHNCPYVFDYEIKKVAKPPSSHVGNLDTIVERSGWFGHAYHNNNAYYGDFYTLYVKGEGNNFTHSIYDPHFQDWQPMNLKLYETSLDSAGKKTCYYKQVRRYSSNDNIGAAIFQEYSYVWYTFSYDNMTENVNFNGQKCTQYNNTATNTTLYGIAQEWSHVIPLGIVVDSYNQKYLKQITYNVHMVTRDNEFMFDEGFNTGECSDRPSLFFQPANLSNCDVYHDKILSKDMPCTYKFNVTYDFKNSSTTISNSGFDAVYGETFASYRNGDIVQPDGSIKKNSESFSLVRESNSHSGFNIFGAYINGDKTQCNYTHFDSYRVKQQYSVVSGAYDNERNATYIFKLGDAKWNGAACKSYHTHSEYNHRTFLGIKTIAYVKDEAVIGIEVIAKNYSDPKKPADVYTEKYDINQVPIGYASLIMPERFAGCDQEAYGYLHYEMECDAPGSSADEANIASISITILALMLVLVSFISF